ncbi:MAG: TIM-barrel domain-containing protein [Athalassotoga sp.]|uniref:glycoside hydrolase family 31 protein n=1 Tax=Athalassotoga sp. TaxID=2022597 RepID=UPI003D07F950
MPTIEKINGSIFKVVYGNPTNPVDVTLPYEDAYSGLKCEEINGKLQVIDAGKTIISEKDSKVDGGIFSVTFSYENAHFFGFGEKMGYLDKRGKHFKMQNMDNPLHTPDLDPMYISIPFFIAVSPKKPAMGIFANSTSYTFFKTGNDFDVSAKDDGIELYLIYGPKVQDVVGKFTQLVGKMEMPPAWSLGYQQSRWSYSTASEALDIAKKLRSDDIPCDVIYLDIDYMDGYRVFTWGENFKNPKSFSQEMKKLGFKIVTIIDPGVKVDENYEIYKSGKSLDAFVKDRSGKDFTGYVWPGRCNFPDFLRSDVREWWAKSHKSLFENGVDGVWNDMNEPAIVWTDSKTSKVFELMQKGEIDFQILGEAKAFFAQEDFGDEIVHKDDKGKIWPHFKVRNIYAYLEAMATKQAFEMYKPNKRPFILTRAGFAGIQKYAAVWTGDNSSWWEHLEIEMPISMGLGMSGVAFTGTDVGGFGGNADGELLARWTEMGAFFPFFRNHSAIGTSRQEPWSFGKQIEDTIRKYIKLRYALFPYIYTAFYFSHKDGVPVMRPLLFLDQDNENLYSINDEFLFGDSILVAPITRPNATWRTVYIPKGKWIDMRNGNLYEEDHVYKIDAPLDEIPIFIKENSMIFKTDPANYIFEKEKMNLYVDIYGQEAVGYLYEDDGETLDYKAGKYNLYEFAVGALSQGYTIGIKALNHGYAGKYKKVQMNFLNAPRQIIEVTLNGKKTESHFDGKTLKVEFEMEDVI